MGCLPLLKNIIYKYYVYIKLVTSDMSRHLAVDREVYHAPIWQEIEEYFQKLHAPGFGNVTHGSDLVASPDGKYLVFTGVILNKIEASPDTRICIIDIATRELRLLTQGPHQDQHAAFSPDGQYISFLSDRTAPGVFKPFIMPFANGIPGDLQTPPNIPGIVEYQFWAPDSSQILLGVAGSGAEKQSASGSGKFEGNGTTDVPSWVPEIDTGIQGDQWRSIWLYNIETHHVSKASPPGLNVWDANWCGTRDFIAVVSDRPAEGAWYRSKLVMIDISTRQTNNILLPSLDRQFSRPVASPSGKHAATIYALCSDRSIVAGNINLIELKTNSVVELDANGVDVTEITWIDDENIFFSGLRGLQSVYGQLNITTQNVEELLSTDFTSGKWYPEAAVIGLGNFAVILEGRKMQQQVTVFQHGREEVISSFTHEGCDWLQSQIGPCRPFAWVADDGLEMQGFLALPSRGSPPYPLIVEVHGGPVWAWQNRWPGGDIWALHVSRGYAVFFPNPRGSSGRGQDFIRHVYGDMGGADHLDIITGVDKLVKEGVVDTTKVGITGRSYGGTMAAWIITQTDRFAASVPIASASDWRSQHTTSNIPEFDQIFLQSDPYEVGGEYQIRSALLYAGRYPTPVFQVAGKEDYCVPSSQGLQ